tara:strand:- start:101 stop:259 length:159 start_codon:yes stop_codon:yes gene_type:complete
MTISVLPNPCVPQIQSGVVKMNQIYKNRVKDRVESYFRDKNLLYGKVVHYPR